MKTSASLNETERARAAELAQRVKRELPETLPWIRELLEAGMIAGWRNVAFCDRGPPREVPGSVHGPFPSGRELTRGQ